MWVRCNPLGTLASPTIIPKGYDYKEMLMWTYEGIDTPKTLSTVDEATIRLALLTRKEWILSMYNAEDDDEIKQMWQERYLQVMAVYYKFNPSAVGRIS